MNMGFKRSGFYQFLPFQRKLVKITAAPSIDETATTKTKLLFESSYFFSSFRFRFS